MCSAVSFNWFWCKNVKGCCTLQFVVVIRDQLKSLAPEYEIMIMLCSRTASLCNLHWFCSVLEEHFLAQLSNLKRTGMPHPSWQPACLWLAARAWMASLGEGNELRNDKPKGRRDFDRRTYNFSPWYSCYVGPHLSHRVQLLPCCTWGLRCPGCLCHVVLHRQ